MTSNDIERVRRAFISTDWLAAIATFIVFSAIGVLLALGV